MKHLAAHPTKIITSVTIAVAILGAAICWLAPTPSSAEPGFFQASLSINFAVAVLLTGAALVFAYSLGGFSAKLKHAYALLCSGMALLGIIQFQLPLSILLNIQEDYWYRNSISPILYLGTMIIIFVGARAFAKLFNIRNLLMKSWFFILTLLGVAALVYFLPHVSVPSTEAEFDTTNVGTAMMIVFTAYAAAYFLLVKRVAGVAYTNALAWLVVGFTTLALNGTTYVVIHIAIGEDGPFPMFIPVIVGVIFAIVGLCFLKAGHSFSLIQASSTTVPIFAARDFFGRTKHARRQTDISSIDIVTFTANLASDTQAIDALLDKVRLITSQAQTKELSEADQATLKKVYLELEYYLLEKEKIRVFDQVTLRQTIAQKLQLTPEQPTFWASLPPIKSRS